MNSKKRKGLRLHHRVRRRGKVMCWNPWPALGVKVAGEIHSLVNRPGFTRRMLDLSSPTGRIKGVRSYNEPALQNLPVRTEDGKKIKDAMRRRLWAHGIPPMQDELAVIGDAAKSIADGIVAGLRLPQARPHVSFDFIVPSADATSEDPNEIARRMVESYAQSRPIDPSFWSVHPLDEEAARARCIALGIDYDLHFKQEPNND